MKLILSSFVFSNLILMWGAVSASDIKATRLVFQEVEQGVDPYIVHYTVIDNYLRIDDTSDGSGYIIFDVKQNKIYSVSHFDKSTLVIPEYERTSFKPDYEVKVDYSLFEGAPPISGKPVYHYRVTAQKDGTSELCMDIQLVPGLFPEITAILKKFQTLISGQHALNLNQTPEEFLTPCYLTDLVFNEGNYYLKGLPIQEWHSNEKKRALIDFKPVSVSKEYFEIPIDYAEYSIN